MGCNWKEVRLGDICTITMGQSPKGTDCNTENIGLPLLNGPTEFGSSSPTPAQWTIDSRKQCEEFDLLFCVRGSTTGKMNWANQVYSIGRGLAAIHHKNGIAYRHFIKGLFDFYLAEILASATGSTFPNVSKDLLYNLTVLVPPLETQKQISKVLSALDDKIELNNVINDNLVA